MLKPVWICLAAGAGLLLAQNAPTTCNRTIYANVIALDQPLMMNRLGAAIPGGMIYALARDVVDRNSPATSPTTCETGTCKPGEVGLRNGKRPRPIVVRMSVGDCLVVNLQNLVTPNPSHDQLNIAQADVAQPGGVGKLWGQTGTRAVGFHPAGLNLMTPPNTGAPAAPPPAGCTPLRSDGDFVGQNCASQANPGETRTYQFYASEEGHFLTYSKDDSLGATGLTNGAGQLQSGLFGSVSVEPANAEYYRSQVLQTDLQDATYTACGATRTNDCVGETMSTGNAVSLVKKLNAAGQQMRDAAGRLLWTLTMKNGANAGAPFPTPAQWTATVVRDVQGRLYTGEGHPVVNYSARYRAGNAAGQPVDTPVLNMLQPRGAAGEWDLVHSDLTAIVTGPGADRFPEYQQSPLFLQNPTLPDRREPFREFTVHYHASSAVVQAFPEFTDAPAGLRRTLGAGTDSFAINYGMGGIGAEVLANRLKVGAPADCVECKFEEFFLSSWVLGDPAMLVDKPTGPTMRKVRGDVKEAIPGTHTPESAAVQATPTEKSSNLQTVLESAPVAKNAPTKVFYPDDPSNVYHSYMRDHVKFRISNVSPIQAHVHHQHAHQWLQTPNSDDSAYLDSQMVIPGSTYTLEMTYNGSGNRNQTVGDSIFHCHFYPHFAGGMWSLWRVHDVFEAGTTLNPDGTVTRPVGPSAANRALPDAEIASGTPIPALVPLPSLGMAPMPAILSLVDNGKRVVVKPDASGKIRNPGFPFFIPGVAGHRAPHPPMDFAWKETAPGVPALDANGRKIPLDGGLPRHMVLDGKVVNEFHTRWDFTKETHGMFAYVLPEDGTGVEKAAMEEHARRTRPTPQPDGQAGNFILNGLPPGAGAPFARPDVDDNGNATTNTRRYQAAVVQSDMVLNKEGWHYPQQRWLSLWDDVKPVLDGKRPPQPLFFRANSGESIEFWHTNLVARYYEMDDYQVRTPTDVIGQHIHLVKFDVLASDGAANGFNYEDGTFAPDEVVDRIEQINEGFPTPASAGLYTGQENASGGYPGIDACLNSPQPLTPCLRALSRRKLTPQPANPIFGDDAAKKYLGAQTTIQLWSSDPLMNNKGKDRSLRTVFTHDHFGPSTHQNVGLYAGLLIEPPGSSWFDPNTGAQMGGRSDGGPTNWAANIVTANPAESYREFALEFQDLQEAYTPNSITKPQAPTVSLFTLSGNNLPPGDKYATYILELQQGRMPPGLALNFQANGITLSKNPNRTKVMPAASCPTATKYTWCIQDPQYPGQTFGIQLTDPTPNAPLFSVFTPTMPGSWADPTHALASSSTAPDISPTLINANPATGIYSLNYRNEPVPLRLNGGSGKTADPAWAFASLARNDAKLNAQPAGGTPVAPQSPFFYPPPLIPSTLLNGTDPFTPLLSAYENDRVQIRTLVGAHTMTHSFRMNGLNWLYEPDYKNSGYKSAQGMGLSEHFELQFTVPSVTKVPPAASSDYFYAASSSMTGIAEGLWGLMRAYDGSKGILPDLKPLPNNPQGHAATAIGTGCPAGAPVRTYTVIAASPQQIGLTNGLVYNTRGFAVPVATKAAVYVNADDLQGGKLKPGITNIEPLILRANAGDCIQVTLGNSLASSPGLKALPTAFSSISTTPSMEAGLQADLLSFNVRLGAGMNIGNNQASPSGISGTVSPGGQKVLEWYAGKLSPTGTGIPIEFGSIPLLPADPLNQAADGMIGTLVIEPAGSTWALDPGTRASATITPPNGRPFREFVVMLQNALVPFTGQTSLSADSTPPYDVTSGINYRSEPMGLRQPSAGGAFVISTGDFSKYTEALNTCGSTTFDCLSKSALAPVFKSANSATGQGFTLIPSATSTATSATQWKITNGNYSINVGLTAGPLLAVSYSINSTTNAVLLDYSNYLSNTLVTGSNPQPQTPIFCAAAGQPVRFRVTQPGGDFDQMMVVDGHGWKQEPYTNNSTRIGNNVLSQQMGTQVVSPNEKLDLVIGSAGGPSKVPGDYLYHSFQFQMYGMWGVFRVVPENTPANKVVACAAQ